MAVLVFKTDIEEKFELDIRNILYSYFIANIIRIDFDFEDCDNILRIESNLNITSNVQDLLKLNGFTCEAL